MHRLRHSGLLLAAAQRMHSVLQVMLLGYVGPLKALHANKFMELFTKEAIPTFVWVIDCSVYQHELWDERLANIGLMV
jgi:hypothetical protein